VWTGLHAAMVMGWDVWSDRRGGTFVLIALVAPDRSPAERRKQTG